MLTKEAAEYWNGIQIDLTDEQKQHWFDSQERAREFRKARGNYRAIEEMRLAIAGTHEVRLMQTAELYAKRNAKNTQLLRGKDKR